MFNYTFYYKKTLIANLVNVFVFLKKDFYPKIWFISAGFQPKNYMQRFNYTVSKCQSAAR